MPARLIHDERYFILCKCFPEFKKINIHTGYANVWRDQAKMAPSAMFNRSIKINICVFDLLRDIFLNSVTCAAVCLKCLGLAVM